MPAVAAAQQTSGIAGQVSDDTGGVLPGVTVEVASPALIEGVRIAFTDGEGRYNVTPLPPGTYYTVTFTLPGFSTIVREGVELTGGFTAGINVEMSVGGIEETITVTGATKARESRGSVCTLGSRLGPTGCNTDTASAPRPHDRRQRASVFARDASRRAMWRSRTSTGDPRERRENP